MGNSISIRHRHNRSEHQQMKNKKCYWEYRVIVRELPCYDTVPSKNFVWGVHEVYFENDIPTLCTELPTYPMSEDSIEDLQKDMTRYAGALLLPILNYSVFADAERSTRRRAGALDSIVGQQLNEGGVGSEK